MDRAVVLVSGGLDSAVALYWAREQGWDLQPLTFHYRHRAAREVRATREVVGASGGEATLLEADLGFLAETADLREEGLAAPSLRDAPPTYATARNLVFYSAAAYFGETLGARWIVGGHNGADSDTFPDASPAFFRRFNALLKEGLLTHRELGLEVVNPLQGLTKAEVVQEGVRLGVPFRRTWSCHRDQEVSCGACSSCQERADAFVRAGVEDPLVVAVTERD